MVFTFLAVVAAFNRAAATPIRHALLVGLSDYKKVGLENLTGDKDARLIRNELVADHFFKQGQVLTLTGHVTKAQFLKALKKWILMPGGRSPQKGDVLYLHFSGHGDEFLSKEMKTLEKEETGLVFSDSNLDKSKTMFTNPEFESAINRVGNEAKLIITIDACHSGDATKTRALYRKRGLIDPQLKKLIQSGQLKLSAPGPNEQGFADSARISGYTVIGACQFDQEANDTGHGGLFTVSWISALHKFASQNRSSSYRQVLDVTRDLMLRDPNGDSQTPVIEGDDSSEVFGVKHFSSPPYYATAYSASDQTTRIAAGSMFGIKEGQFFDLYKVGDEPSAGVSPVAKAKATDVQYDSASLVPIGKKKPSAIGGLWAFPRSGAIDPGGLSLAFNGFAPEEITSVQRVLVSQPVAFQQSAMNKSDFVISKSPSGSLEIEDQKGRTISSFGTDAQGTLALAKQLQRLEQWQAVMKLDDPTPKAPAYVDVQFVRVRTIRKGAHDTFETETGPLTSAAASGDNRDWFAVRVRAAKKCPYQPYVGILQLSAERSVSQFWPDPSIASQQTGLLPTDGRWYYLGQGVSLIPEVGLSPQNKASVGVWQFASTADVLRHSGELGGTPDGIGGQIFKVFATQDWVDYRPLLTAAPIRAGTTGTQSPLARILKSYSSGKRDPNSDDPGSSYRVIEVAIKTVAGQ